jgi:hypothetical protein
MQYRIKIVHDPNTGKTLYAPQKRLCWLDTWKGKYNNDMLGSKEQAIMKIDWWKETIRKAEEDRRNYKKIVVTYEKIK